MNKNQQVPRSVVIIVLAVVLLIVGYIGYRYVWAPPSRGNPQILGPDFFQSPAPAQATPQGTGASGAYGGASIVRPGSGN